MLSEFSNIVLRVAAMSAMTNVKSTLFQQFIRVIGRYRIGCEIDDCVATRSGPHSFAVLIATGDMMRLQLIEQCVPPVGGSLAAFANNNAFLTDIGFRHT